MLLEQSSAAPPTCILLLLLFVALLALLSTIQVHILRQLHLFLGRLRLHVVILAVSVVVVFVVDGTAFLLLLLLLLPLLPLLLLLPLWALLITSLQARPRVIVSSWELRCTKKEGPVHWGVRVDCD